jgi:Tol biopolymer transport system component/DNA-binding winged helix-turn-helix (wHTH) protein
MAEVSPSAGLIRFGVFELDRQSGELRKAGVRVALQEQAFQVLTVLLERPGDLVTRDELRQRLWPHGTFVDFEHGLNAVVNRLRDTLGDSADAPRFVETVPRRGYRFIAPVDTRVKERDVSDRPGGESGHTRADVGESGSGIRPRSKRPPGNVIWLAIVALTVGMAVSPFVFRLWPSPRAPIRTTPFTTLPGQERHPSFSPDGNQLAFVWDGETGDNDDIYIKVIGAEVPLRLTTHPAADRNPVWSPDGRQIAFTRASEEGSGIFVTSALGGPERKIVPLRASLDESAAGPSWSPNGQLLAVTDIAEPHGSPSLFIVAIETRARRKLTAPPQDAVGDFAPAISPDGRTVAFIRVGAAGGIYVVPVGGGEPRLLTSEQRWWVERLAWTADGRHLVFSSSSGAPGSSSSLWKVSASGGTPERLAIGGDNAANPTISSRGDRLAYEQHLQDANIWRIEVPTSTQSRRSMTKLIASTRHEAGPQFSQDGTKIAFHSDRTGTFEIWVCDRAGSSLVQLTSFGGPLVGTARWSPDNRHIAFDVSENGRSDIYVADVDASVPRRVPSETSDEMVPSWSPDGRWIYFASNRTGRLEVWKVPAAGGSDVQVTKRGGFAAFESKDGRFVYYSKGVDTDGLWRVAVNGGEEGPVLAFPKAGLWGYWALVEKGIYFVNTDARPQPALEFLSFSSHQVVDVAGLNGKPIPFESGMAVSPDGRWILYTQEDHRSSDIMLVENFR